MDHYTLLGVNRNSSPEEIKKSFRRLSMKHHPDRGGDENKFKEIKEAYEVLSDPKKKQMYDMGVDPNQQQSRGPQYQRGPFEFRFGDDPNEFFSGFGFNRNQPRNSNVSISISIDYEDIIFGKNITAEVSMPGNRRKLVTIDIPKGIEDGQHIRYQGMGDDSIRNIPAGDLIVNIKIVPHPRFHRQGDDLICEKEVSVWDCMLGSRLTIDTVDKRKLNVNVPPGCQPGTTMRVTGEGVPNMRTHRKGNLLIRIKTTVPRNITKEQKAKIKQLRDEFRAN